MNRNQYRRLFTVVCAIAAAISFLFIQSGVEDVYVSHVIRPQERNYREQNRESIREAEKRLVEERDRLAEERRLSRDSSESTGSGFAFSHVEPNRTGLVILYPDHIRFQRNNIGFIAGVLTLILLIVGYFIFWTVLFGITRYVSEGFGNEQGEGENE